MQNHHIESTATIHIFDLALMQLHNFKSDQLIQIDLSIPANNERFLPALKEHCLQEDIISAGDEVVMLC